MSGTFGSGFGSSGFGGFGAGGKGFDISGLGQGLGEAFEKLRASFDQRTAPSGGGGDARASILALLAEKPRHGSELIQEIGARTAGSYTPGPGDVYPTLQLLVDEGLITWEDTDGRRLYSLTQAGVGVAADATPAWGDKAGEKAGGQKFGERAGALGSAGFELAQAVAQVGRTGSAEQVTEAVAILDEARRRMHGLLSQD